MRAEEGVGNSVVVVVEPLARREELRGMVFN